MTARPDKCVACGAPLSRFVSPAGNSGAQPSSRYEYVCGHFQNTDEIPGDQLGTKALIVVAMAVFGGAAIGMFTHLIVGWLS